MISFLTDMYAVLCYAKEKCNMYIFKTMVPIYGYLILNGSWVLTKEEAVEGKKAIPKRYVELVSEWLAEQEAKRSEATE